MYLTDHCARYRTMFERAKRTADVASVVEKIEGTIAGLQKLVDRSAPDETSRQLAGLLALRDEIRTETGR